MWGMRTSSRYFSVGAPQYGGVRPLAEAVPVLRGDAQQLGDDGDGQWERIVVYQIHLPPVLHSVQQHVGYRLDARAHPFDEARGEGLRDERPEPLVVWGVGVKHVLTQGLHDVRYRRDLGKLLGCHDLAPVLHEALVLEDG